MKSLSIQAEFISDLRYGENPHQTAQLFSTSRREGTILTSIQHQGKELSFNNIADADAALALVKEFDQPACVIVKHMNPCGVAIATTPQDAYAKAFATDPTSAFGGIIAFNSEITDGHIIENILRNQFAEVIIAPVFSKEALEAFTAKKNIRVLAYGKYIPMRAKQYELRQIDGGFLYQEQDNVVTTIDDLICPTKVEPTLSTMRDLLFTWKVAAHVKSNAIVYGSKGQTIGVGAGQMSRIISAKIASMKAEEAGLDTHGAVMASDAFFPFRDSVDLAALAGIKAIIQPGGSMRDQESIDACDEHNIAMVFTGIRHFKH